MLRALNRALSAILEPDGAPALTELTARVEALESAETVRAAEHAAMCDRLERLYKRMVTRVARETSTPSTVLQEGPESVLTMRDRVRRERGA